MKLYNSFVKTVCICRNKNITKCHQCFLLEVGYEFFHLASWAFGHFPKISQINVYNLATEK